MRLVFYGWIGRLKGVWVTCRMRSSNTYCGRWLLMVGRYVDKSGTSLAHVVRISSCIKEEIGDGDYLK